MICALQTSCLRGSSRYRSPALGNSSCTAAGLRQRCSAGQGFMRFSRSNSQGYFQVTTRSQCCPASASKRVVWVETTNQAVLTAAVESGFSTAVFRENSAKLADDWQKLASFEAINIHDGGSLHNAKGQKVGQLLVVSSKADLQAAEAAAQQQGYLVMDATDWKVIPAENLVAAFQSSPGQLLGVSGSAADARVMMEALEAGTAGVVLRTEDPLEVKQLAEYLLQREAEGAPTFTYETATLTRVDPVGMCDRVCVDLCSLLRPGEGMLVGSFARALFLVHSECMESQYINSRPFRVNAGAVHAYVQAPGNKTAYLSELKSGSEVLVVDAAGRTRTAVVGRCKIETRPMMLIEAETVDGSRHSTLLQNAETVRLIGPSRGSTAAASASKAETAFSTQQPWEAVAVTELQLGQKVYLLRQEAARHTGISIKENINEK